MRGSAETYQRLLSLVVEWLPEVAQQISTEVARGTPRSEQSDFDRDQGSYWAFEIVDKVEPFKRGVDVSMRNYTGDERLAILVDALRTVAETMLESRQLLLQRVTSGVGTPVRVPITITFSDPAEVESNVLLAAADLADTEALARAAEDLMEVLDVVRPRG